MFVMTGANGRLGRLVAHVIADRGMAEKVTLGSRDPEKIDDLKKLGFKTARLDFNDPLGMRAVFEGAEAVLAISMPGPVDLRIPLHRNAFDAIANAGVGRLIYTSRVNPSRNSLYPFAPIHVFSEEYIRDLGIPSTIVRNNEYMQNIAWLIKEAIQSGKLILPGATGRVAYVSVNDIAEILAKVLTESGHADKIYELNGPAGLHRSEIASMIEDISGRSVIAVPISKDAYGDFMERNGRPDFVVTMLKGFYDAIDANEFEKVWPDTENLLGRRARSMQDLIAGCKPN